MPDDDADAGWEHPGRAQRWTPERGDCTDHLFPLGPLTADRRRTRHPVWSA